MSDKKLINELENLRAEIAQMDDNSNEARTRLNTLIDNIENSIEEESSEDHSLAEDIREAVIQFETEHPRATAILNEIMVSLSNMGI